MKLLNGQELAGFIKERQAKEVRRLRQAENIQPKLAIVQVTDDPVVLSARFASFTRRRIFRYASS